MVFTLGVARDLRADHAGCVVVVLCATHPSNGALVEDLDLQRTGRRAVCGQAEWPMRIAFGSRTV